MLKCSASSIVWKHIIPPASSIHRNRKES
jgi:hypothetical protein